MLIVKLLLSPYDLTKGSFFSESNGGFSKLPKYVPKTYLVLFNAVHSVDKMANVDLFVFTSLIDSYSIQIDIDSLWIILQVDNFLHFKKELSILF